MDEKLKVLEAILYAFEGPHDADELSTWMEVPKETIASLLAQLQDTYKERGVRVVLNGEEVQLTTAPDTQGALQKIRQAELSKPLTKAGLETLTIIAFLQPTNRATIDLIRGVQSHQALRHLLMRGLVIKTDSTNYTLSTDALGHLGIGDVKQLADYEKIRADLLQRIDQLKETETKEDNNEQNTSH